MAHFSYDWINEKWKNTIPVHSFHTYSCLATSVRKDTTTFTSLDLATKTSCWDCKCTPESSLYSFRRCFRKISHQSSIRCSIQNWVLFERISNSSIKSITEGYRIILCIQSWKGRPTSTTETCGSYGMTRFASRTSSDDTTRFWSTASPKKFKTIYGTALSTASTTLRTFWWITKILGLSNRNNTWTSSQISLLKPSKTART